MLLLLIPLKSFRTEIAFHLSLQALVENMVSQLLSCKVSEVIAQGAFQLIVPRALEIEM